MRCHVLRALEAMTWHFENIGTKTADTPGKHLKASVGHFEMR